MCDAITGWRSFKCRLNSFLENRKPDVIGDMGSNPTVKGVEFHPPKGMKLEDCLPGQLVPHYPDIPA